MFGIWYLGIYQIMDSRSDGKGEDHTVKRKQEWRRKGKVRKEKSCERKKMKTRRIGQGTEVATDGGKALGKKRKHDCKGEEEMSMVKAKTSWEAGHRNW